MLLLAKYNARHRLTSLSDVDVNFRKSDALAPFLRFLLGTTLAFLILKVH